MVRSLAALLLAGLCPAAAEPLRVGGVGAASETLSRLGAAFAAVEGGAPVEVVRRLGTSGSLRAAGDGVLHVVVAGRRLTAEEWGRGLREDLALRTPFAFATSHPDPGSLRSELIAAAFSADRPTFADGTPMRVLLRPRSESDSAMLSGMMPGMSEALDKARARADVPVAATDQDNAELAERVAGSLTGITLLQAATERRELRLIPINGIAPSLEALEAGTYPFAKTLHVVVHARPRPDAERFVAFLRSPEALAILREAGATPTHEAAAARSPGSKS